ncbi:unnamed protein product [Cyprideis torosa]|uniref:Uncharacterized protein n=1 Tax=Cyprideis torosa TaxID=163714 RepID=A0A7R8W006_9CRUS|nr:unnamed protein product [Cyprideis torosa]CAG0879233.1 unnamed protein product [Cyprideis torosa]
MDTSSTNSASSRFPPDITKSEVSTTASDKKIGVAVSSYAPSYKRKESDNVVRNGTTERPSTFRPVIPTSTFSPGQKNSEDGKPPNKVNEIVNVMNNRREFIVKAVPKDEAKPYDVHLHQNQSQSSASSGADKDKIKKAPPSKPAKPVIEPKPVVKTKVRKEITGYVGFANLPNQVHRKAARKGFEFTVMVIGETGIGKSTLVNSMFMTNIYSVEYPSPSLRVKETVEVETTKVLLTEKGVKLSLTIVDTPGFGDAIDNSNSWQCLSKFVDERYEEYLRQESRVNREPFPDTRVNCCLYFISPNGRRLRPVDVECMKELHDKVNIIPIIAKADTLTPEEVADFKKEIMREIQAHKIRIYDFPPTTLAASGEQPIKDRVPFAIVGANTYHEVDGKRVLGRRYPWGVVDVQNMEHCDFLALRDVLIRTHLIDLKEVTDELHYENFRIRRLGPGTDASLLKSSNLRPERIMDPLLVVW